MEYYDFKRLDVFKQYHDLHANTHRLELKYKELWKSNLKYICVEIRKRDCVVNNVKKKEILVERKNKICENMRQRLADIVVDKCMLYMLANNKIKLNMSNMSNVSKSISSVKFTKLSRKILVDSEGIDTERALLFLKTSKEIKMFYSKMKTHLNFYKIEKKKGDIYKSTTKNYSYIDKLNEALARVNESVCSLDKRHAAIITQINNLDRNCTREYNMRMICVSYLSKKIKEVDECYNEEVKRINEKYSKEFKDNGEQTCSICLEDDSRFIKTNCGHYFHVECLGAYIHEIVVSKSKIDITCPYCRQYITS